MRLFAAIAAWAIAGSCLANEQEIQRALIQRDQQSAEFAASVRGGDRASLEALHARQRLEVTIQTLHPDSAVARQLEPYQRQKMADERALVLPPPVIQKSREPEKPLPLPGGPRHGVDPVTAHGTPN
ncbi:MAG TPA: hypothetical protein VEX61_04540 [Burkholderiales bacterium]|nr:hypothetical protein [Burkholderiales bacterium]